ncbi:segregation and condensation protein A [Thiorhodococcus fuscus]|uniref:Segregation and condensation protein A n=1 Tax=Thiorhodococcus fuscus TaxID=527200 RepID=A0ABW4Y5P3_9GAMM
MSELTKEQEILIAMRKTLSAIVRDVTPPPGMRHPLSDGTIQQVRDCLGMIAMREKELADAQGRGGERPYFADEAKDVHLVPIAELKRRGD